MPPATAVSASELDRLRAIWPLIQKHAATYQHAPALVAAIVLRETLAYNVIGDKGHGHGLMQVDDSRSRETGLPRDDEAFSWCGRWRAAGKHVRDVKIGAASFPLYVGNEEMGIERGCLVLAKKFAFVRALKMKKPLSADTILSAAIASYNTGEGNVRNSLKAGKHPDTTTTGGDYSRAVLARVPTIEAAFT